VIVVVIIIVSAYDFYPRPRVTTDVVTCNVLTYAIISIESVVSSSTIPLNVTETSITSYSTITSVRGTPGQVIISTTTSPVAGFNGYGQDTFCTYLGTVSTTDFNGT